ncbi:MULTISPECIES: HypC/HybG/HupF family hydrogenase formation chaperone [Caloramator]|jgi:hydrogenase expression/formation protein HypC|uniref:[NiFe] hydrogenase metallocenter assembly protein HypC n=1 Tax=Caloramator australicus RC3 TaxID=857293 RepID=I7J502_9CLOT|nr:MULTISPECIES: HypC/HybG/HupF family hydrogenase formation chaperone [Caloramator]MDO6354437.1 HypC/HybG/HupF family hydrogenase formation chaperone [Caloramator sp. CAR-1]CCJ33331.1 [NiFe] hydrogenase metallocenter assembly protein HypC [Caloramator australicus RC3]
MCLAVPLKVIEIDGNDAVAELDGIKMKIRVDFVKDIKIGDYVYVHAGFAINKLDEKLAKENLELFREVANAAKNKSK